MKNVCLTMSVTERRISKLKSHIDTILRTQDSMAVNAASFLASMVGQIIFFTQRGNCG